MALEGTHIKFALELLKKGYFEVANMNQYLSRAIYPDSRYHTGIARELTHPDQLLNKNKAQNDFDKGWHTHLLYDHFAYTVQTELFPEILHNKTGYEGWIWRSAIKIIEDALILRTFDIHSYLSFLSVLHTPCQENPDAIAAYQAIIKNLYQTHNFTNEYSLQTYRAFGIEEKTLNEMRTAVTTLLEPTDNQQKIQHIMHRVCEKIF